MLPKVMRAELAAAVRCRSKEDWLGLGVVVGGVSIWRHLKVRSGLLKGMAQSFVVGMAGIGIRLGLPMWGVWRKLGLPMREFRAGLEGLVWVVGSRLLRAEKGEEKGS